VDIFPVEIFNPASIKPLLARRTITGGVALSGEEDVIVTDGGGRWEISFEGIELETDDQVAAWNAWDMHLDSGATPCVVPIALPRQAPLPIIGTEYPDLSDLDPADDDPYFPNAAGRAHASVVATIDVAALLRATQLTITVSRGRRLRGGEPFTIVHPTKGERLYRIKRVLSTTGQTSVVEIRPPLREAVASVASADFDWPRFRAHQAPAQDIAPLFNLGNADAVSITFVEAP
jgi:hypothetical protein